MRLNTPLTGEIDAQSVEQVTRALAALDPDRNNFAILAAAPETYIQTAFQDGQFVVEKREGAKDRHFKAYCSPSSEGFALADVQAMFAAYLSGAPMPFGTNWRRMDFSLSSALSMTRFSVARGALLLVIVAALFLLNRALHGWLN